MIVKRALQNETGEVDVANTPLEQLPALTMVCALDRKNGEPANRWLSKPELAQLRGILKLPSITAARAHTEPRRKLEKPLKNRNRLTIMVGQDPSDIWMLDHKAGEMPEARRCEEKWKGVTVFYNDSSTEARKPTYVETPEGVLEVHWTRSQRREFQAHLKKWHKKERTGGVFLLKMRASGKELDPKAFDQQEAKRCPHSVPYGGEDGAKKQDLCSSRRATELSGLSGSRMAAPLRMVRTNRSEALDKLLSKSRMVAPGHLDPHLG